MFAIQSNKSKSLAEVKAQPANVSYSGKDQTVVNPAWQSLALSGIGLQAKLSISAPSDPYEQEADRVADQVMRTADPRANDATLSSNSFTVGKLQRKCSGCEDEEEKKVQRKEQTHHAESLASAPSTVHEALNSPGRPLDPITLSSMENNFGRDFSDVRVHSGAAAEQSARDVNANAYTVGHDIVFGRSQFAPATHEGQRLLAHELTHVVQQSGSHASRPLLGRMLEQNHDLPASVRVASQTPISAGNNAGVLARQSIGGLLAPEPRSLKGSLAKDKVSLNSGALTQEIKLIEEWLKVNPAAPETEHLQLELEALRLQELLRSQTVEAEGQQQPEPKEGSVASVMSIVHLGRLAAEEVAEAHRIYMSTGQIPQTKTPFSWIEIKIGRLMSRSERYDTMMVKQGKPFAEVGDVTGDNRDPEFLTRQEFHDEFWARYHAEWEQCDKDHWFKGPTFKCQRGVDEKYGGPGFKVWRDNRQWQLYLQIQAVQEKIEGVVNSGGVATAGRAIGGLAAAVSGHDVLAWSEGAASLGSLGDTLLFVNAGRTAQASNQSYSGSAGLVVNQDAPTHEVTTSQGSPAATAGLQDTQPATAGPTPTVAAIRPREITTLTNVRAQIAAADVLPKYNPKAGFSGVYHPSTRQWLALASGNSTLISGVPVDTVPQYGGHLDAEAALVAKTGITDTNTNIGFVLVWKGNNIVQILWNSGQINGRNFNDSAAPARYREPIRQAVAAETGFQVIE